MSRQKKINLDNDLNKSPEEKINIPGEIEKLQSESKEEKEKKPRGKKAKEIKEEQIKTEEKTQFIKDFSGVGSFILDLIIPRLPNPIPVTDQERESFTVSLAGVAFKYMPYIGKYSDELNLLITSFLIFSVRLKKDKKDETEINKNPAEKIE